MTLDAFLIALGAIIASVITAVVTVRLYPVNWRSLDAGASKQYAEATKLYADEVKTLRAELDTLREELHKRDQVIEHMQEMLEKRNAEIARQRQEIGDLREWAARLVEQVKEHRTEPVKMRRQQSRN